MFGLEKGIGCYIIGCRCVYYWNFCYSGVFKVVGEGCCWVIVLLFIGFGAEFEDQFVFLYDCFVIDVVFFIGLFVEGDGLYINIFC